MAVSILTSQNVRLEYEPASIGERIAATFIDYAVFIGWVLLTLALPAAAKVPLGSFYVILVGILPLFLYDFICEWQLNGQTLGKIAMNIRVVMLDGSQPGIGAYLMRWLLRLVDTKLFSGLVAIIAIAASERGQRIGDIAAGTTVVRLKASVSLDEVTVSHLPADYQVTFPEVNVLSDRDIHIIREVMLRGDADALSRTAQKVKEVTGTMTMLPDYNYLKIIVNDYQFLATQ